MAKKSVRGRPPAAAPARPVPRARNELRIIGGKWRGRRVRFAPVADLRPSPDRVRETLFNWLQGVLPASRCLDLFAGSGALGLEALSRGAAEAVFVERDASAVHALRDNLATLDAGPGARVHHDDAMRYLRGTPSSFDVVFLDPPFASDRFPDVCRELENRGWLAPRALIYMERPARVALADLPATWNVTRSKRAGEVGYHLARRETPAPRDPA